MSFPHSVSLFPVPLSNCPINKRYESESEKSHVSLSCVFLLQVVEKLENVKQIEVKPNGRAEFSLDMTLHDPNSAINLYKVGLKGVPR